MHLLRSRHQSDLLSPAVRLASISQSGNSKLRWQVTRQQMINVENNFLHLIGTGAQQRGSSPQLPATVSFLYVPPVDGVAQDDAVLFTVGGNAQMSQC